MSKINWEQHFKEYPSSGLGVKAYCRKMGLSSSAFYYQKKKTGSNNAKNFVPVIIETAKPLKEKASIDITFDADGDFHIRGKVSQLMILTNLLRKPS